MGIETPSFMWIGGWAEPEGKMAVSTVDIIHERMERMSDKFDKLTDKVEVTATELRKEIHVLQIAMAKFSESILLIEKAHAEQKVILERLSDDNKFWRRFYKTIGGIFVAVAAYAVGLLEFFKSFFK